MNFFLLQDSKIVIERYKSGLQPPSDIPFEDLSDRGSVSENHNHTPQPNRTHRSDTLKGTVSGGKSKKRPNILASIFSSSKVSYEGQFTATLPWKVVRLIRVKLVYSVKPLKAAW